MRSTSSIVLFLTALIFFVAGCAKTPERMPDFNVDFATVSEKNGSIAFLLDNQQLLIPEKPSNYTGKPGQRVIINYTVLDKNVIKVNQISDVLTGNVQTSGFPEKLQKDPVKVRSIWVSGGYLNMVVEIEYHSKPHAVALLQDMTSASADLYFSHGRNEDPPGYNQTLYASFSLKNLLASVTSQSFNVFVQTKDGVKKFTFSKV